MIPPSRNEMLRIAEVPTHHVDEGRVALGGPDAARWPTSQIPAPTIQRRSPDPSQRRACR